mgnify:FL=1
MPQTDTDETHLADKRVLTVLQLVAYVQVCVNVVPMELTMTLHS